MEWLKYIKEIRNCKPFVIDEAREKVKVVLDEVFDSDYDWGPYNLLFNDLDRTFIDNVLYEDWELVVRVFAIAYSFRKVRR